MTPNFWKSSLIADKRKKDYIFIHRAVSLPATLVRTKQLGTIEETAFLRGRPLKKRSPVTSGLKVVKNPGTGPGNTGYPGKRAKRNAIRIVIAVVVIPENLKRKSYTEDL